MIADLAIFPPIFSFFNANKMNKQFSGRSGALSDRSTGVTIFLTMTVFVLRCQKWSKKSTKKSGKVWNLEMENV